MTIIRQADGRFYTSFVEDAPETPLPAVGRVAGADVRTTDLVDVTYSDGSREIFPTAGPCATKERALARAQKSLAGKKKGSRN